MASNISKYVSINDFVLLEYEFNRDGVTTSPTLPYLMTTELGTKEYFDLGSTGNTNNGFELNSIPANVQRTQWYTDPNNPGDYWNFFDTSTAITPNPYQHDTVKIHIVSGYNFDDISGFLLQIRAQDTSSNLVDMSNFTWIKQVQGSDVNKFSSNTLYLGNRFYDKYVELKIPSIGVLGGDQSSAVGLALNIAPLSDAHITYSTIETIDNAQYILTEIISTQLPVTSVADNFNCFIAESTSGDYIEFYAIWNDLIIGEFMPDIESGRIRLYTSNNPNDNFENFSDQYGVGSAKWVVMHELYVYEHIPGGTSLQTSKFVFTQEDNFIEPNFFRPVIENSDIASSYTIDYICRLMNRMDGSQIIRRASFASTDPTKYGRRFIRLNVDNVIPYNVFNRLEPEAKNILNLSGDERPKFVKVFYDTTNVVLNAENTVLPQGTGPLFLKKGDSIYNFKFDRLNVNKDPIERENVDLSGAYRYQLLFVLDDDSKYEIPPTFSTNMNTVLGQLEFKIMGAQIQQLLKQTNNTYSIQILNPDGTSYTFYEGLFFDFSNITEVSEQYKDLFDITNLQTQVAELTATNESLTQENAILKQS